MINTCCFTTFYNFQHKHINMANRELRQFQTQKNSILHYNRANKGFVVPHKIMAISYDPYTYQLGLEN